MMYVTFSERLFSSNVNAAPSENVSVKLNTTVGYMAMLFSLKKHLHKASQSTFPG